MLQNGFNIHLVTIGFPVKIGNGGNEKPVSLGIFDDPPSMSTFLLQFFNANCTTCHVLLSSSFTVDTLLQISRSTVL